MRWGRTRPAAAAVLIGAVVAWHPALPPAADAATAKPSDSFVDSIGVNVHTSYTDTPYYSEFETVKDRLQELGVRHVRDDLVPNRPDQYQAFNELAGVGIDSTLIMGNPYWGTSVLEDELIPTANETLSGAVAALEGPNEWSTSGDPDWKANLIAYQERLYEVVQESSSLSHLPVIGPSIVHGDHEELGDVSAFLDYGNIHSYPEGGQPQNRLGFNIEQAEKWNSKSKPIMATETGYTNALNWEPAGPGENKPITAEGAATYMPRLFFEYFRRKIARTFVYELLDEFEDPELENREANFGLLRHDLTRKPAFLALRDTIDILEDPGPAFSPGSLDYSVVNEGAATLHETLLQKRDGTFYLAFWRLQSIWDQDEQEPLEPTPEPVTVDLETGVWTAAVYTPTVSSEPISFVSQPTDSFTVDVGPDVTILELEPAIVPPSPPLPPPLAAAVATAPVAHAAQEAEPRCVVPNLRGKTPRAARKRARGAGCKVGRVRKLRDAIASRGRVVRQRPRAGRAVSAGTRITITVR